MRCYFWPFEKIMFCKTEMETIFVFTGQMTWCRQKKLRYSMYDNRLKKKIKSPQY